MSEFGNVLKLFRKRCGISQEKLADLLGTTKQVISRYERGERSPKISVAKKYAEILGMTLEQLNGAYLASGDNVVNMADVPSRIVPIVGEIACGTPITAEENVTGQVAVPSYASADFALVCKGDSMTGARIMDGDLVCIRQQDDVTDGQIAAVLIDTEATLKRVYHNPDGTITLVAENPKYPPRIVGLDSTEDVRIIGLATHFISAVV